MEVFGTEHLMFLAFSFVAYLFLLIIPDIIGLNRENTRKIFAILVLSGKTIELFYQFILMPASRPLDHLPLHLCDIAHILAILMLFTGSKEIFEILYFWSIGAIIANITPELSVNTTFFRKILFFLNHVLIVLSVSLMVKYYSYKVYFRSLLKAFIILVIYSIPIFALNFLIDTNFLFLRRKPVGGSLIDYFGPWPNYIITLFFVVFIIFFFLYIFSIIQSRFKRKR